MLRRGLPAARDRDGFGDAKSRFVVPNRGIVPNTGIVCAGHSHCSGTAIPFAGWRR